MPLNPYPYQGGKGSATLDLPLNPSPIPTYQISPPLTSCVSQVICPQNCAGNVVGPTILSPTNPSFPTLVQQNGHLCTSSPPVPTPPTMQASVITPDCSPFPALNASSVTLAGPCPVTRNAPAIGNGSSVMGPTPCYSPPGPDPVPCSTPSAVGPTPEGQTASSSHAIGTRRSDDSRWKETILAPTTILLA
ncbi:hypothetical protein DUI87_06637 [Hirundo rustica rustica]|uniref:Uncharacterized protein n=1 Tax=Hirundo rustica rustica TaxID=333673 RepID=A0A3M0LBX5_HIRRU|nr:hypothetical protein DUI87_06637 [Hirundo rustica rustica]